MAAKPHGPEPEALGAVVPAVVLVALVFAEVARLKTREGG